MSCLKHILIIVLVYALTGNTMAQGNRTGINWSRLSGALTVKRTEYYAERENSYNITASQQDYFTVLANARYMFKEMSPALGLSYWLLYDNKGTIVPEWRPHLQFQWEKEKNKWMFSHRTRLENRFIQDTSDNRQEQAYHYTLRPRILFQTGYSLMKERNKKGSLQLVVSDEILLEYNKHARGFAENRLYAGFWYEIAKQASLQLGYVWIFFNDPASGQADIIYLTLRKDIALKKGGKKSKRQQP